MGANLTDLTSEVHQCRPVLRNSVSLRFAGTWELEMVVSRKPWSFLRRHNSSPAWAVPHTVQPGSWPSVLVAELMVTLIVDYTVARMNAEHCY